MPSTTPPIHVSWSLPVNTPTMGEVARNGWLEGLSLNVARAVVWIPTHDTPHTRRPPSAARSPQQCRDDNRQGELPGEAGIRLAAQPNHQLHPPTTSTTLSHAWAIFFQAPPQNTQSGRERHWKFFFLFLLPSFSCRARVCVCVCV